MVEFYTIDEFAQEARISTKTVRRWLKEGKIKGKQFGRIWRIPPSELQKILPNLNKDK